MSSILVGSTKEKRPLLGGLFLWSFRHERTHRVAKGGKDVLENIVICAQETNEEKADTFPNWYANERRFQARKVKGTSNEYDIYQMD